VPAVRGGGHSPLPVLSGNYGRACRTAVD